MYSFSPLTLFLCHVQLHMHLLNSTEEGLVIILPSNNPVCPQKTSTRILLPIILGAGHVKTPGRIGEKTENSLCIVIMPLEQVPSTASRSNYIGTDLFLSLCALPNAHLELHCKACDKEGRTALGCFISIHKVRT